MSKSNAVGGSRGVTTEDLASMEVQAPEIILEGYLCKRSRGRSTLAFMTTPTWKSRMVLLYSNKKLQYWDNEFVKGDINVEGAIVRSISATEADGQPHAFEITNPNGDKILFSSESAKVTELWVNKLISVIHNQWKINKYCKELSQLFSLPLSQHFSFDESYNRSELINELTSVGGAWRYELVYYDEYFVTLIARIKNYLRIVNFEEKFLSTFTARKIRIRPSKTLIHNFHITSTIDGILLIEFQSGKVDDCVSEELGLDLCEALGMTKHVKGVY